MPLGLTDGVKSKFKAPYQLHSLIPQATAGEEPLAPDVAGGGGSEVKSQAAMVLASSQV